MSKTVVGLFISSAQAEQVKQELMAEGYPATQITVHSNNSTAEYSDGSATANDKNYTDIGSGGGTGIGEKISHFFRSLSGGDEEVHHHYATGVNSGGALLSVTVSDSEVGDVVETLRNNGATEIQGGSASTGFADTEPSSASASTNAATTGEIAIPVVEEELVVGKRDVSRGGVRVYSHVVEKPVEASVTLHDEQINVERRAVNRPATAADFSSNSSAVTELTATGEEAVVGKTSRVVEEVLVGKQQSEHTESIHDSVRKTEVEVEQYAGQSPTSDRR